MQDRIVLNDHAVEVVQRNTMGEGVVDQVVFDHEVFVDLAVLGLDQDGLGICPGATVQNVVSDGRIA